MDATVVSEVSEARDDNFAHNHFKGIVDRIPAASSRRCKIRTSAVGILILASRILEAGNATMID